MPGKHTLNPPIVTILGGGIAGLTAAHELVERGFYVQVIEATEDPYCPGRPIVGGMAANQPARVRANIEDLHRDLIKRSLKNDDESEKKVATWLLGLFAFNRSGWIQTERPANVNRTINKDLSKEEITVLLDELVRARDRYRQRWIWDLTVRGVLIGTIRYPNHKSPDISIEDAKGVCASLEDQKEPLALALGIRKLQSGDTLPSLAQLGQHAGLVTRSLQREFLCFGLTPSPRDSKEAQKLLADWGAHLAGKHLEDSYDPAQETRTDEETVPSFGRPNPPAGPGSAASLQIDVLEQRLPGEHGFRFFPTFYRHVEDTMRRIPLYAGDLETGRSVLDNLKPTIFQGLGFSEADRQQMVDDEGAERPPIYTDPSSCKDSPVQTGATVVDLYRDRPSSLEGFRDRTDRFVTQLGGTRRDAVWLFARLVRFLTSSPERRREKYEGQSWAEFLKILDKEGKPVSPPHFSKTMIHQIQSAAQALLAFSAAEADARSYGDVAIQLLLDGLSDGTRVDRTLTGPTTDAWLEPWRNYLERQGVRFFCGRVKGLAFAKQERVPGGEIVDELIPELELKSPDLDDLFTHERLDPGQRPDFYVLALNVEQSYALIKSLKDSSGCDFKRNVREKEAAPDFEALLHFGEEISKPGKNALKDMTGLQYFFESKTSIGRGHMYFPYTRWGLSSISQSEFWCAPGSFSDGYFGVLSVGICETGSFEKVEAGSFWHLMKHIPNGKDGSDSRFTGPDHRRFAVARKVWDEIRQRIKNEDGLGQPRCFHVDQNITPAGNTSKFLASLHTVKSRRPGYVSDPNCVGKNEIEYSVNFERWAMCGTFMATHTRITTMEAANESARHAVNAILRSLENDDSGDARGILNDKEILIKSLRNKTYNGASADRVFDSPDIVNLEDLELEDLEFFRRVDRRLLKLGLPHFFDIIDFDRKLEHALDAVEIYKGEKPLREFLGLTIANIDSALVSCLGQGYDNRLHRQWEEAKGSVPLLADALDSPPLGDMKGLLGRLKAVLDKF